jgi:hypothetical protein
MSVFRALVAIVAGVFSLAARAQTRTERTVLPIQQPTPALYTELDARNAKAPPRFEVKAPAGAPNVLIVLIDDMGFSQSSAFGGPIHMPTVERLANNGLRFNQFPCAGLPASFRQCWTECCLSDLAKNAAWNPYALGWIQSFIQRGVSCRPSACSPFPSRDRG